MLQKSLKEKQGASIRLWLLSFAKWLGDELVGVDCMLGYHTDMMTVEYLRIRDLGSLLRP